MLYKLADATRFSQRPRCGAPDMISGFLSHVAVVSVVVVVVVAFAGSSFNCCCHLSLALDVDLSHDQPQTKLAIC